MLVAYAPGLSSPIKEGLSSANNQCPHPWTSPDASILGIEVVKSAGMVTRSNPLLSDYKYGCALPFARAAIFNIRSVYNRQNSKHTLFQAYSMSGKLLDNIPKDLLARNHWRLRRCVETTKLAKGGISLITLWMFNGKDAICLVAVSLGRLEKWCQNAGRNHEKQTLPSESGSYQLLNTRYEAP